MVAVLQKGQNASLDTSEVSITVRAQAGVDVSALLVGDGGKVRSDADFVFYNQPSAAGVNLRTESTAALDVSFGAVEHDIAQVRAVITLDDPESSFGQHAPPVAVISDRGGNTLYEYVIDGLSSESIVVAVELYRRGEAWKVRAVGQGYAGGFADLITDHGVTVDDDPAPQPATADPVRSVPGEQKLSLEKRQVLNLRKQEVAKVLLTKGAAGVRARVVLVIDKTGSMTKLYQNQVVHRVVQRMIPVAIQLDDDGVLEPYLYARKFAKLPDIRVEQADEWCTEFLHLGGTHGGIDYSPLGGSNDEIPIMQEIIGSLQTGDEPTLVLFFTDGGFSNRVKIAQLMRQASQLPAFWQFIGLGKNNFGVLRRLDELDGRLVDNAGFFAAEDIDRTTDEELYQLLLSEFPDWLRAARAAQIVR